MKIDKEYFWSDSQIVLAYLNNDAKRFHVFVANRVQFIRDHTRPDQWHYIPSEDNPADHTSRGLTANELLTSNWFTVPTFLHNTDVKIKCTTEKKLTSNRLVQKTAFKNEVLAFERKQEIPRSSRLYA